MKPQDLQTLAQAALTPNQGITMTKENHAEQQAAAQYESIVLMLDALDADYDRLEELKDERQELIEAVTEAETNHAEAVRVRAGDVDAYHALDEARAALSNWEEDNSEELEELTAAAGECADEDEARDRITEDPLEVQVRSDWTNPGEELTPGEFMILLCTGGPAVRIVGELDQHGEPCRAWMEYQDWDTPWTQYWGATSSTLCRYASHFFGG